jgi:hypothetical protein
MIPYAIAEQILVWGLFLCGLGGSELDQYLYHLRIELNAPAIPPLPQTEATRPLHLEAKLSRVCE